MIQKQAQNLKRPALFTENEQNYLKGKIVLSRVAKSKFHRKLDKRFDGLLRDLELLRRSEKLKTWKLARAFKYHHYFLDANYFSNIFSDWERSYPDIIHRIKKKNQIKYWLEPVRYDDRIDDRMFKSEFLFRRMRTKIHENDKESLVTAYERQGILPFISDEAIDMNEIRRRLCGESKVRTNVKIIDKVDKETFKDPRNFEIHKIITRHSNRNFRSLNKKLTQYDSKLIKYVVEPVYHAEPAE